MYKIIDYFYMTKIKSFKFFLYNNETNAEN